jgi:PTS system nitrogen regulatory IIA component
MTFTDILAPDGVIVDLKIASKKQAFQELAKVAANLTGLDARAVFDAILERERLGSTGVGHGVAIPHARLPGLPKIVGVFARLAQPIDFDAVDERPTDLVFMLLAPEGAGADHLKALARVSRAMRREDLRDRLRAAPGADAVRALLSGEAAEIDAA